MGKSARQKLIATFWVICGFAFAELTVLTMSIVQRGITSMALFFFFSALLQLVISVALIRHWRIRTMRPGTLVTIAEWISGLSALFAVIDFLKRGTAVLLTEGMSVLLFVLWLLAICFIHQDKKERRVCEFC